MTMTMIDSTQGIAKAPAKAKTYNPESLATLKNRDTPSVNELRLFGPVNMRDSRFLRNVPKQQRALDTVDNIVRVLRNLLNDPLIGRERMTTAMVAEVLFIEDEQINETIAQMEAQFGTSGPGHDAAMKRLRKAGLKKSIGTMYRYFEDMIAMLDYIDPYREQHASYNPNGS